MKRSNQPGERGARKRVSRPKTPPKHNTRPKPPKSINQGTDSPLRKAVRKRTKL